MMYPEIAEGGSQTAPDLSMPATPAAPAAPAPESTPTPEPASAEPVTQAVKETYKPQPELSLREKLQKKAAEVAAQRQKDPVTGKFLAKPADPTTPNLAANQPVSEPIVAKTADVPADPAKAAAYAPNFKLKVMEQDRDIPEILRPLMKDEASSKAIKEIMEKAYGLDYVKPKLEETRAQLGGITSQIQNAQKLFQANDIDGWLKALSVPEERILQWVADKLEYSKLPPEQKAILDQRKQADARAFAAEQQAGQFQQQHEQILTQQVQMALDSVLARTEVDSVAKAYDARLGKPGAFKEEINRRGDYIWRTTNQLTPPEKLVQELMSIVGPVAPPINVVSTQAPAQGQTQVAPVATKPSVIPNISGRSTSALPSTMKSLADLRAKHKEIQDAKRV